jgi:hypothetical protein
MDDAAVDLGRPIANDLPRPLPEYPFQAAERARRRAPAGHFEASQFD